MGWPGMVYWIFTLVLLALIAINYHVYKVSKPFQYKDIRLVPSTQAGLVLGTAKYRKTGGVNKYFTNRLITAAALYKAGKIEYLILSGDNSHDSYNEPVMMKKELLRMGVPENAIYLDFAGFRTLDSVIRGREIFGQQSFIIISQSFHNRRALFIARKKGIQAFAFNAPDVESFALFKTRFREIFARIKMLMDIYLFNREPHFLGEKIELGREQVF
ncbi:MAG: YdcF family protein [Bacteroidetes bacterium]|nr:YdcF family protein [Bacteroidota bacterium]